MKQPQVITLKQLKFTVYEQYQVENSRQLKQSSSLAAQSDLRYKKSWYLLKENKPNDNVVSLASHIVNKGQTLDALETGLKSLKSDAIAFREKIKSDFADKRENSQKYRESLTYI